MLKILGVSQNSGYHFGGPLCYNKDPSIWESILGSLIMLSENWRPLWVAVKELELRYYILCL